MSGENSQQTVSVPVPPGITAEQLLQAFAVMGQQISQSIAAGIQEARPQKKTFGQFPGKSPFHADRRKMKRLTRPVYQNGTRLNAAQLFDEEILALNKLVRSGRYINRLIEVIIANDGADEVVELRYKNRTPDAMMEHKSYYRDLREMLRLIVKEHDEKLAEEGLLKEQRQAFSSAATRAARAKAAAEEQSLEP